MAGLVLMGLGCAPVFPSLMHEAARRFPADVARTVIGRQMMAAYAGGSVIPAGFGLLATWVGLGAVMPMVMLLLIALLKLLVIVDLTPRASWALMVPLSTSLRAAIRWGVKKSDLRQS